MLRTSWMDSIRELSRTDPVRKICHPGTISISERRRHGKSDERFPFVSPSTTIDIVTDGTHRRDHPTINILTDGTHRRDHSTIDIVTDGTHRRGQ